MLRIQVFDEIKVTDDLENVVEIVADAFKRWHEGDQAEPFVVTIENEQNKSPPPLEINVHETIITKSAFGTK